MCHGLGCLLASREDLSLPEAKVFRGYGNPIFTKVPLYQKPLPDFGTMNSKQMDRQLPLVKQYRRLQTLLNTARRPSSTNLHTSIQQWNAIVSHFTTLDYNLPADLQVTLGLPFQQTPLFVIKLEKLAKHVQKSCEAMFYMWLKTHASFRLRTENFLYRSSLHFRLVWRKRFTNKIHLIVIQ